MVSPESLGRLRCTHKEPSGHIEALQVQVTFRTATSDFGATVMVRMSEELSNRYVLGNYYNLYILPAEQRVTDKLAVP